MFTTVNRIVYRCGEQARHGKISAMVPASEALPGLLSAAAAPQGPCMAPAVPWGVTSPGVICDQSTCCSSQRCQPWQPAASPSPLPGGAAGVICWLPAPTPSPEGTPGHHTVPCPCWPHRQSASQGSAGRKGEGGASLKKQSSAHRPDILG